MSMLAEPRRKVKYGSNPRGEDWARDENKFGQKLMEKMGWSKGKGLGANEDGHTEHIKVQVKNDNRGVGCSKNHADNWIAHQDDFNALLSTLQQSQSEGEQSPARHSNSQVQSLEQKSQTSKSRVHYKKFARGKDLSGKNTEDLDCVFGRRKSAANAAQSEERSEEAVRAVRAESSGSDSGSDSSSTEKREQESSSEKSEHGVVTINTGLSVHEYFAQKMAALRRGKPPAATSSEPQPQPEQTLASAAEPVDEEEPVTKKKKSKKKKKEKEEEKSESGNSESSDDKEKKKQKKKKDVVECETDNKSSKKKCKKSKDERIEEEGMKSKKKKRKTTESDEDIKTKKCNKSIDEKANTNEEEKVSKKKCKKSKDEKAEEEMECHKRKPDDSPEAPPKKQKKRKTDERKIAKLSEAVNDFKDVNLDQIKGINNGEKLGGFKRR